MEYWLPQLRDPYFGGKLYSLRQRLAGPAGATPDLVMLGSSRTGLALRGQRIETQLAREVDTTPVAYNFGVPGAGPVMELICLRRLLAAGIRPRLLLIEVFPSLLGGHEPAPQEAHFLAASRLSLSEILLLERYGFPKEFYRRDWWASMPLVPWYAHRFAILNLAYPKLLPVHLLLQGDGGVDAAGWWLPQCSGMTPQRGRRLAELTRQEYTPVLKDFCLCNAACRIERRLLDLCRDQMIPAILVLMPEASEFRKLYPPAAWAQIEDFLEQLSCDYGVLVVNAREWIADEEFYDLHHLQPSGASLFTDRLCREVVLPWFRNQRGAARVP
jgi:hypothetical protein